MTGGQWEKVGAKSKKSKPKNGAAKSPKEKKKQNDAVFEVAAPICEAQTIYTAFLEKEKKEPPPAKPKSNVVEPTKNKDKISQSKKKKEKRNVSSSKINLENVYSEVSEDELKNHLATLKLLYPENHMVWLKDVASLLNVKLDVSADETNFSGKPPGYPSSMLNKGVYKLIVKLFNLCTQQQLQLYFEHCLQNMVQDTLKGIHTLGYRTVIQCLAQDMPHIAVSALPKCLEICNAHQNRQNVCVSIMWAAGQAGNKNLEAGFQVWTDLMFQLIGTKTCTAFVVDYLENLVHSKDVSKINKSIISVKDLFHILDFIHSKELVKTVQKRLISLYPTLKVLSYGSEPELVLRNYFPSYLHRLKPECPQTMKDEILSSLVFCLENDIRNFSIWRQLYSKHFNQSKMLIAHLNEHWGELPKKFPKRHLLDTLSVFQVTNEELINSGRKDPNVEECILLNKEMLSKINSQMFPWLRVILMFLLALCMLLTYDIITHGSFEESYTGKFMKDTGLLVICAQTGEKLSYCYGKIYKLLQTYVPSIITWTKKSVGPYLELFWKHLIQACISFWDSTSELRIQTGKYIKIVLNEVNAVAPVYGNWILSSSRSLAIFLKSHLYSVFSFLWSLSESVVLWAQSNSTVQNAMDSSVQFIALVTETMQSYAVSFVNIIKSYIPS